MTMAEMEEMWDGHQYMRSRDLEVLAQTVLWLIAPHLSEQANVDFDKVTKSLPGYDRLYQRSLGIDKPQQRPWNKRKKNA